MECPADSVGFQLSLLNSRYTYLPHLCAWPTRRISVEFSHETGFSGSFFDSTKLFAKDGRVLGLFSLSVLFSRLSQLSSNLDIHDSKGKSHNRRIYRFKSLKANLLLPTDLQHQLNSTQLPLLFSYILLLSRPSSSSNRRPSPPHYPSRPRPAAP